MDWTAGARTGVVPGLYGRVLASDADLARGRAARTDAAQDQARRRRNGALITATTGPFALALSGAPLSYSPIVIPEDREETSQSIQNRRPRESGDPGTVLEIPGFPLVRRLCGNDGKGSGKAGIHCSSARAVEGLAPPCIGATTDERACR